MKLQTFDGNLVSPANPLPVDVALTVADEMTITAGGTVVTGETLETGGAGLLGWLSSIRKAIATTLIAKLAGGLPAELAASGGLKVEGVAGGIAQPVSDAALDCAAVAEYNVTLTNANMEYSQALPANARKVIFRCRTADTVRYAWATGKVATPTVPYQTLRASAEYALDGIKVASGIIYLASATAGVVIEMEAWS